MDWRNEMIREVRDCYTDEEDIREVTFKYNTKTDKKLLNMMIKFLSDNQPTCFNCENYYTEGGFGGYQASCCKIHGCIEAFDNPHHDTDGSKCEDYKRK